MARTRLRTAVSIVAAAVLALTLPLRGADTLPSQLSDAAYWELISDFSEPDKYFQLEIITSNETAYQRVLPQLTKAAGPGGTYLGVGPEQNFTYIAVLRPKIAFLIDIRRDMLLEHLMYKAIFEMSAGRADFVGRLFSRKRPAPLTTDSSVEAIFQAYSSTKADPELAAEHLKDIITRLRTLHRFALSDDDEKRIRSIYLTFSREGVATFHSSFMSPGYAGLMLMTDGSGRNWSFLASEENYARVRAMHEKNLIVPLVGDFAGPKALRMAGQYLRDHGAIVNVFYLSNVEDYIRPAWAGYARNVASLPVDASSVFIRWAPGRSPWLASMADFVRSGDVR